MDCHDFLARYSEYDDSLVGAAELDRFRAHLDGCGSCARYDRVLRKGRMLARQLPPPRPSRGFVPRLHEHLVRTGWGDAPDPASGRRVLAGMMLAFAGLVVASSSLWIASGHGEATEGAVHAHSPRWEAAEAPRGQAGGRAVALPRTAWDDPADWSAARVDRRVVASYSPVVVGPPAYRSVRTATHEPTQATRSTLD